MADKFSPHSLTTTPNAAIQSMYLIIDNPNGPEGDNIGDDHHFIEVGMKRTFRLSFMTEMDGGNHLSNSEDPLITITYPEDKVMLYCDEQESTTGTLSLYRDQLTQRQLTQCEPVRLGAGYKSLVVEAIAPSVDWDDIEITAMAVANTCEPETLALTAYSVTIDAPKVNVGTDEPRYVVPIMLNDTCVSERIYTSANCDDKCGDNCSSDHRVLEPRWGLHYIGEGNAVQLVPFTLDMNPKVMHGNVKLAFDEEKVRLWKNPNKGDKSDIIHSGKEYDVSDISVPVGFHANLRKEDLIALAEHEHRHAEQYNAIRTSNSNWHTLEARININSQTVMRFMEADAYFVMLQSQASWRYINNCLMWLHQHYTAAEQTHSNMPNAPNEMPAKNAAKAILQNIYNQVPFPEMKQHQELGGTPAYDLTIRAPQ
jgi:hypothetical protein